MRRKSLITFVVLIAFLAVTSSVYAFQTANGPDSCGKFHSKNYLKLSNEQLAKMNELRNNFRNDTRDLRYNLEIKHTEMHKLYTDPKTDDATLLAKQKEINDLKQQLSEKRGQMKIEWRKILTPEQIAKLDRIQKSHHGKRHGCQEMAGDQSKDNKAVKAKKK